MTIDMLAWTSVYLYGLCLTAAFLSLPFTKRGLAIAILQTGLCLTLQFGLERIFGYSTVEKLYPLICHLPILLSAVFIYKRSLSSSAVALLAAYLLTTPRQFLGEFVAVFWKVPNANTLAKIIVTLPLLLLFLKLLTPIMRRVLLRPKREQMLFLAPALAYYLMIYTTTVYTQLAYTGGVAVMSLLGLLMCLCTFIYVFMDFRQLTQIAELRERQQIMELQSTETALRLEEIRYSQAKTRTMRHDLRHYLQIIHDYAVEGNAPAIESYIHSIQGEIEDTVVQEYCKNESVNLILSSYYGKAKRQGTEVTVTAALPDTLENELNVCVVLANGLENALHACAGLTAPTIRVACNSFAGRIVIQIQNPYAGAIKFVDGLPVSDREGHGLGTKSIVSVAESHGGAADFSIKSGVFTMRAVL